MSIFTIDSANNITAHAVSPANANNVQAFSNEKDLAKLAADWPAARLVELWNSFAGVTPFDDLKVVKKFTSRQVALGRIWQAAQRLLRDTAPRAPHVATRTDRSKKSPAKATRRAKARKEAPSAREGSKKAEVLGLMRRATGVTLDEIMKKTDWQAHTVRGFVSGTITKKLGLKVESFQNADGQRAYRITA